jgi:hypothetical protein
MNRRVAKKKKVAIIQSFYVPWKGYFDIMNSVDEFILLDDIQYQRRFWINRNRIKTSTRPIWLTIPVKSKGKYHQVIRLTEISDRDWQKKHWETIKRNYKRAKCFSLYKDLFEELYLTCDTALISEINERFILAIRDILGITSILTHSTEYALVDGKTERLIQLCKQSDANIYLTGPTARDYLEESLFDKEGIEVEYMDYSGYPKYPQLYDPFIHQVSILDLIFNVGPDAPVYMKSYKE